MTLIIAAANPHFAVQVSDRRLTSLSSGGGDQAIVAEEFGKSLVWLAPNGRFIVGFTGITEPAPAQGTTAMISEILLDLAPKRAYDAPAVLNAFATELTQRTRQRFRGISAAHRRLTVMFTGFLDHFDGESFPTMVFYTNFQVWGSHDDSVAWDHFEMQWLRPRPKQDWPTVINRIGAWPSVSTSDGEEFRELLAVGKPPRAVIGKMVARFPGFAAHASETVGGQLSSVILKRDRPGAFQGGYHTAVATSRHYDVSQVLTFSDLSIALLDPIIENQNGVAAVPRMHRSAPCACGSGMPYGRCHGRAPDLV